MRVRLFSPPPLHRHQKGIHWPNADVILGHRLRRWANIFLTLFEHASISPSEPKRYIYLVYIKTVSQKCQPSPTHGTPPSAKQDIIQAQQT